MVKQSSKYIRILLLALIPAIILFPRQEGAFAASGGVSHKLEEYTKGNFPFSRELKQLGMALKLSGGQKERAGVFIGGESLVKNISPPQEGILEKNTSATAELAEFAHSFGKQVYFTLIPTASAISVQSVPRYAETYNQHGLIENTYGELTGKLTAVDCYLPLYTNRNQYLYYRTEDNLTAYGGYQIYAAMAKRMLGIAEPTYNAYEITYAGNDYYGDLYKILPLGSIRPDTLILFKYVRTEKEYTVTHRDGESVKTYHTLFPPHRREQGRDLDVYLGGLSDMIEIKTSPQGARSLKLLVLGDKTALSYLPFLVNHYGKVTFIDLSQDEKQLENFQIDDYDQLLMAYGVETYTSPDAIPSRAMMLVETNL